MLHRLILISVLGCLFFAGHGQGKLFTKTARIHFIANNHPAAEANSPSAVAVLDTKSGDLNFSILVKSFELKKAAMQEKFNAKVLETDVYPKAEFKGKIENNSVVNYQMDGSYPLKVIGKLTMHGVTNDIVADGILKIERGTFTTHSTFDVLINDYKISNPGIGDGVITITVDADLEVMKD